MFCHPQHNATVWAAIELLAKVVETLSEDASRVVVCFTPIPEAARTFLDTAWGYGYHVINRAEQGEGFPVFSQHG
jgi:hypothetical protein